MTLQPSPPTRRSLLDWASLTSATETDADLRQVVAAVKGVVSDAVGLRSWERARKTGNFGEAEVLDGFSATAAWTTRTQAVINGWHEEGRCVGSVNLVLRGGTGLGRLPLLKAVDLVQSVYELGFSSVRRLDVSLDVFDHPELTIGLIRRQLADGYWRIPRRDASAFRYTGPIRDADAGTRGASLQIGARGDDRWALIYDKGAKEASERAWIRFEVHLSGLPAEEALLRLSAALDAGMESADPDRVVDRVAVALVRSVIDIRDLSAYADRGKPPKNWAQFPSITYPPVMHPVFDEIAPLELGSFKASGVLAARTRHLMRSSGRHMWKLCVLACAKGDDPGAVALTVGASSALSITREELDDLAAWSGFSPAEIDAAEAQAHLLLCRLHGVNIREVVTDRQELRAQLERSLGGV